MLRALQARAKAGVEIKVIGSVSNRSGLNAQKLAGTRLHTRTIIRDRRQAFVGSQSLRAEELDKRRELGLIIQDAKAVKILIDTFESDWVGTTVKEATGVDRRSRRSLRTSRPRPRSRKQQRPFKSSRRSWIHSPSA